MNEPSNQSGGFGETFSSHPATGGAAPSGTNPFTADLKGEFTSNFGTNTNAVSQIFKEGGFAGQSKTKYYIIGGVAALVVVILAFAFMDFGSEEGDEEAAADGEASEEVAKDDSEEGAADKEASDTAKDESAEATSDETSKETVAEEAKPEAPAPAPQPKKAYAGGGGYGKVSLGEPADGATLNYDETQGAAMFTWTGGSGYVVFGRNANLNPPAFKTRVNGNQFAFQAPWPGTWYWKVQNSSGSTEVRSFKVNAPARRNIQISQPAAGAAIAGSGGVVAWQADGAVAYYRVEFSNGGWANPAHRFATSGNSVQLQGVPPGDYQMRVGAFSEVSGRFEYSQPMAVKVQ